MKSTYQLVAVGGTFDRLHRGHAQLLTKAFAQGNHVIIGLTSDSFVATKKLAHLIKPYTDRYKQLIVWLRQHNFNHRSSVIRLKDMFGTTTTDPKIEALIVSEQTLTGAHLINQKRQMLGFPPLKIEVAPMITDTSGQHLSSTRIRQGITNSQGLVYDEVFNIEFRLNNTKLQVLNTPMGPLVAIESVQKLIHDYKPSIVAVVGDISLNVFLEENMTYDIGVFDNKSERKEVSKKLPLTNYIEVINPAGYITTQAVDTIRQTIAHGGGHIKVIGEEDLLTLCLVLMLPLRSLVFYGQPGKGLVVVEVDEQTKDRWYKFLKT